jgi:O-antigen ligase
VAAVAVSICAQPLVVPAGPGNLAPADVFLLAAVFATLLWARNSHQRLLFPYTLPVAIFMAGGALGSLVGPVPSAGILALAQDALLLLWCWTVVNIGRSAVNMRILVTTWVYSSIVWTTLLFVGLATGTKALTGQIDRQGSRVQLTLDDPSYAANYFFISLMIIWATKCPRHRGVRYAAVIALAVSIVLTGSISGMVSLVAGTVIAMLVAVYRRRGMVPMVTCLVFVLLAGAAIKSTVSLETIQQAADSSQYAFVRDGLGRSESESDYRQLLFHESVGLFKNGGVLGQGPVSTKTRLANEQAPYVKEAHDDYLAALLERGVIGFLGFLLLLAGLIFRTVKVGAARPATGFVGVIHRPNALVGAMAGTLITGAVYELLHVRHVWTLFGLVAAMYIWGRE